MNRLRSVFLFPSFAVVLVLAACAPALSTVRLSLPSGGSLPLRALDAAAKKGVLEGPESSAWFAHDKPIEGFQAIEVRFKIDSGGPADVSLGLVTADDLSGFGTLSGNPAPRDVSTVSGLASDSGGVLFCSVRMALTPKARGFALSLSGTEGSRLEIVSASVVGSVETGWEWTADGFWAGFPASGGRFDASRLAAADIPPVSLPENAVLSVRLDPRGASIGTPARQARVSFSSGSRRFAFRVPPAPYSASIRSEFLSLSGAEGPVSVVSGARFVRGMRVSPAERKLPIRADPHMIVEWPQNAWRSRDYEVFSWDRFPTVLIFDTADYAVQDRLFKRLAFFVEKQGYRGKLWTDAQLRGMHAFNAHDYRAESLADFFALARSEGFALNRDELELEALLLAEGVLRLDGGRIVPGAGAVISLSRESAGYLRYLFMTHEAYHGIYFINPAFRDAVREVRSSLDPRAAAFLESYFTVVSSLGYDTADAYLMENEFMGYLMQQSLANAAPYFTGQIRERFLRFKGDAELASWVEETGAAEFVRAAEAMSSFAFENWGLAAGRTGLFTFE